MKNGGYGFIFLGVTFPFRRPVAEVPFSVSSSHFVRRISRKDGALVISMNPSFRNHFYLDVRCERAYEDG